MKHNLWEDYIQLVFSVNLLIAVLNIGVWMSYDTENTKLK